MTLDTRCARSLSILNCPLSMVSSEKLRHDELYSTINNPSKSDIFMSPNYYPICRQSLEQGGNNIQIGPWQPQCEIQVVSSHSSIRCVFSNRYCRFSSRNQTFEWVQNHMYRWFYERFNWEARWMLGDRQRNAKEEKLKLSHLCYFDLKVLRSCAWPLTIKQKMISNCM